jgi:hypothetical protein
MLTDMSPVVTATLATFAIAGLTVLFLTWRNAHAGSIAQLLHRTPRVPYHGEIDPRRFSDRDRD